MTTRFTYFLLGLFIVTVNLSRCNGDESGDQSSSTRIVGGTPAVLGEFPAQISLQKRSRSFFCGGTLIDSSHVLTAAHCVTDSITGVVSSPSTVSPPFIFTNTFYSVNRIQSTPAVNTNCSVAGWGTTVENGFPSSILRRVNVSITDSVQCNRVYAGGISSGMICAGTAAGGKDSCQGDSGGGLYCGNSVAGIVSFGMSCGNARYPGVYTNVASYNSWINSTLTWNGGSHSSVPTPTTRKPGSSATTLLTSVYTVTVGLYFVLALR